LPQVLKRSDPHKHCISRSSGVQHSL